MYKQILSTWQDTMFFKCNEKNEPIDACIRLHCYKGRVYVFGSNSYDLVKKRDIFLAKNRKDSLLFNCIYDLDEAWSLIQLFAKENDLKPFIYL